MSAEDFPDIHVHRPVKAVAFQAGARRWSPPFL
jgi:hypothetical protein